jgi:hypothetical protein
MIAYCVVAGVIYVSYVAVAIFGEVRRERGPQGNEPEKHSAMTNSPNEGRRTTPGHTQPWHQGGENENDIMPESQVIR